MDPKIQRLREIDEEQNTLKNRMLELEEEKQKLINSMDDNKGNNIFKCIPARPRNFLIRFDVDNLTKLINFLHGDCSAVNPKMAGFSRQKYEKATTPEQRLQTLIGIGEKSAEDTIKILETHEML